MASRAEMDLSSYDRFFPSQDFLPKAGFGNLIALPLQGERARAGNTVFLDPKTMEPWPISGRSSRRVARMAPDAVSELATTLRPVACRSGAELRRARPPGRPAAAAGDPRSARGDAVDRTGRASAGGGRRVEAPGVDRQPGVLREAAHAVLDLGHAPIHHLLRRGPRVAAPPPRAHRASRRIVRRAGQPSRPRRPPHRTGTDRHPFHGSASPAAVRSRRGPHRPTTLACWSRRRVRARRSWPAQRSLITAPRRSYSSTARSSSTSGGSARRPPRSRPPRRSARSAAARTSRPGWSTSPCSRASPAATMPPCSTRTGSSSSTSATTSPQCPSPPCVRSEPGRRRWLGLTATPYRRDKLEAIIGFHCGPTRHEIKPAAVAGAELVRRELIVHTTATEISEEDAAHIQSVFAALVDDDRRTAQICSRRARRCRQRPERAWSSPNAPTTSTPSSPVSTRSASGAQVLKGGLGKKARAAVTDAIASRSPRRRDRRSSPPAPTSARASTGPSSTRCSSPSPSRSRAGSSSTSGGSCAPTTGKHHVELHDYVDARVPVLDRMHTKRLPAYSTLGFDTPSRAGRRHA